MRFPRLLKISTLEPPKRNRARFPFDSLQGMAKLQQTSVVFVLSQFSQESPSAMANTAPTSGGSRRGIAIPLLSLRVRVHRERGSRNTLSLCVSLVTFSTARKSPCGATGSRLLRKVLSRTYRVQFTAFPSLPQPNITKLCKICYLRLIENRRVWLHNSYK